MESPFQRKLALDELTQPQFERIVQNVLTVGDPAWLLSKIPGIAPVAELVVKPFQEIAKNALTAREKQRLVNHLEASASIVSAIQQANWNTFNFIMTSISYPCLRVLLQIERTRTSKTFWKEAGTRLGLDRQAIQEAVRVLQRVGLVTTVYGFEHADGEYRDYPDLNVAMNYTDRRYRQMEQLVNQRLDKMQDTIVEMKIPREQLHLYGQTHPAPPKKNEPVVAGIRLNPDTLIGAPQTTLAGFYFLQIFEIEAKAQNEGRPASSEGA